MLESSLVSHQMKVEQHEDWVAEYGNSERPINVPWLVCSCTWEVRIDSGNRRESERLLRLEHLMEVMVANSCSDCRPAQPCAEHCPRRCYEHDDKGFCSGCGQKF